MCSIVKCSLVTESDVQYGVIIHSSRLFKEHVGTAGQCYILYAVTPLVICHHIAAMRIGQPTADKPWGNLKTIEELLLF